MALSFETSKEVRWGVAALGLLQGGTHVWKNDVATVLHRLFNVIGKKTWLDRHALELNLPSQRSCKGGPV